MWHFGVTFNTEFHDSLPFAARAMAGNDPKTGGREADRAGSVSAVAPNPATAFSPATDLALRLWGLQAPTDANRLSWSTDSVCVYMLNDLVTSSGGRIDEHASGVMAAHFDSAAQALVAAKRIQISMLEFLAARKGEAIAAAVLIYDRSSTPGGLHAESMRNALLQARPGQILLSDAVAKPWADLPGFQFRAVPITISRANGVGVQELMWTSADELARLQDSIVDEPAPVQSSISMGATMMVGSRTAAAPQPAAGASGDFVFQENSAQAGRYNAASQPTTNPALTPVLRETASNPSLDGLDEPKRSFFTPTKLIVGAVLVILVAAAVEVLYTPAPVKKSLPAAPPSYSDAAPSNPGTNSTTPVSSVPPSSAVQPTTGVVPSEPPAKESAIGSKLKQLKSALKGSNQTKTQNSSQPLVGDDIGGLSKDDLPVLLSQARSAMGAGRYEDARIAFRKILQLQPENQEAKDGLHRIDLIRQNNNQ
jgi:hypothetical protein